VALSGRVTHYGPRSGCPYYKLTTLVTSRGHPYPHYKYPLDSSCG